MSVTKEELLAVQAKKKGTPVPLLHRFLTAAISEEQIVLKGESMRTTARWALALLLGWMLAASAVPADDQGAAKEEAYSAVAAAGGGTGPVRQLRLYIDEYTTDEEAAQVAAIAVARRS